MRYIRRLTCSRWLRHPRWVKYPVAGDKVKHLSKEEKETLINHGMVGPDQRKHAEKCVDCRPFLVYGQESNISAIPTPKKRVFRITYKKALKRRMKRNICRTPRRERLQHGGLIAA